MTCGVYVISCMGRDYVGSSKNIEKRWRGHSALLQKGMHQNNGLQGGWDNYAEHSFKFNILEECVEAALLQRETWWIQHLDSYRTGYNQTAEALPMPPKTDSWREGRRQAMIEMNKTRKRTPEEAASSRERILLLNQIPHSLERRAAASQRAKQMHADGRLG